MNTETGQIRTRFAPSPTGVLHVGGARTALFNYLFTRQNKGKFILRIEDTDKERSKKDFEEDIKNGLKWLDLQWDEFYRQSERKEIYKKYLEKLLDENKAYFDPPVGGKAIRFKNPNQKVVFNDTIRGDIAFNTTELGDFIIAKNMETPLFHFAGAVDDFEMKITHVIRGEDHISNTPRQILIQEAIGAPRPIYAHLPLILGPDRSKLSKRHGATSLNEYKEAGYLPEALVDFLALLGWNPGDEREIFTLNELIKEFSLKRIQKSGAIFNINRLKWLNKQYLKTKDSEELAKNLIDYLPEKFKEKAKLKLNWWKRIVDLEKERIDTLSQIGESIGYFFEQPKYEKEKLLWKEEKNLKNTKVHLKKIIELLKNLNEKDFLSHNIQTVLWEYANEKGKGNVLWPFRVALTGLEKSPEPFVIAEILGKKETIQRIQYALDKK